ncbi:MAG: formylglycine-generating enzyme family protein [Treponema sp.]|nr:formylglycine-generating enzyme family protein [Treponema sp.]
MKKINLLFYSTLLAVLCFTTCDFFLDRANTDKSGYGKVSVNIIGVGINDTAARTVYPNMLFEKYVFVFAKVNNIGVIIETLESIELETDEAFVFELEVSNWQWQWQVTVSAYAKADDTTPAASGKSNTFAVTSGATVVTANVQLDGVVNTGSGTFSYCVTFPEGAIVTKFTLEKLFEGDAEIINLLNMDRTIRYIDDIIVLSGTVNDIPAGYYYQTIQLDKGDRRTGANEVIYIYDKVGSVYGTRHEPVVFTDDNFSYYPLSGTVVITGTAQMGETLTVNIDDLNGTGTISYQWYSNTTNSNTGGTVINGETNSSYTIPTTLMAGTHYYFCEVRAANRTQYVRSDVVIVFVEVSVITINTQPTQTTSVYAGNISGNLSIEASVTGYATLSYQWYSNTTNSNTGGTVINGATGSSFIIPTTLTAGTYYYFCETRATNGALSVRSDVANVNVSAPVITINNHPVATTSVFAGKIRGNLSVEASVSGGATPSYQWYSNTTNSNTGGNIITDATSTSYIIPNTLSVGTYYYYCQVTATSGATPVNSSIARINVITPIEIEMIQVAGGSFELGRNLGTYGYGWDYTPVSTVNISGFYIGKYPITQAQYQTIIENNPSYFHGGSGREPANGEIQERRPVESVSWYDAIVFCNRLSIMEGLTPAYSISGSTNPNDWGAVPTYWGDPLIDTWDSVQIVPDSTGYRLPTEAQWEYAAKGGNGSPGNYSFSGSNDPDAVAWYEVNSGGKTHEVGKKAPNSLGIYDMSGNVNEWCWDWWGGSYTNEEKTDPLGPSGPSDQLFIINLRVVRGGWWGYTIDNILSVSRISDYYSNYGSNIVGFRLVRP